MEEIEICPVRQRVTVIAQACERLAECLFLVCIGGLTETRSQKIDIPTGIVCDGCDSDFSDLWHGETARDLLHGGDARRGQIARTQIFGFYAQFHVRFHGIARPLCHDGLLCAYASEQRFVARAQDGVHIQFDHVFRKRGIVAEQGTHFFHGARIIRHGEVDTAESACIRLALGVGERLVCHGDHALFVQDKIPTDRLCPQIFVGIVLRIRLFKSGDLFVAVDVAVLMCLFPVVKEVIANERAACRDQT